MITAGEFGDVNTALLAGARHLLDSLSGSRFLFHTAFGSAFFLFDGALLGFLILVASLVFMEWHVAEETVAGVAFLAAENVAVVFDEQCTCILSLVNAKRSILSCYHLTRTHPTSIWHWDTRDIPLPCPGIPSGFS